MINIISIPTSQISMLLKGESVTLCKWPAFQFKCIHSLVHDKYKYNAAEIRTGLCFLAHLSQRLIGELIVYQWSGVRRPSVRRPSVVRRPSASSTMLKHLLLRNRLADQSQTLCGASLGRGNNILFAAFGSHDQDGRHAHIW